MGTCAALAGARAFYGANSWPLSLEFSLAPIFSSRTRHLRGRGAQAQAGVSDPGYSGAWTCRVDGRRRVDLPHHWFVRFPSHLDFSWIGFGLGLSGVSSTSL